MRVCALTLVIGAVAGCAVPGADPGHSGGTTTEGEVGPFLAGNRTCLQGPGCPFSAWWHDDRTEAKSLILDVHGRFLDYVEGNGSIGPYLYLIQGRYQRTQTWLTMTPELCLVEDTAASTREKVVYTKLGPDRCRVAKLIFQIRPGQLQVFDETSGDEVNRYRVWSSSVDVDIDGPAWAGQRAVLDAHRSP
jgi:hypothetical protein